MKLHITPSEKTALLELNDFEFQLIVLALSRTAQDSEANAGAQTKPLKALEQEARDSYHQWQACQSLLSITPQEYKEILEKRRQRGDYDG